MGWVIKTTFFYIVLFFVIISKSSPQSSEGNNEYAKKQSTEDHWTKGKIVLVDNTVFEGQIDFQENFDLVRIKTAAKIKIFTPKQVKHFTCYDPVEKYEKLYISIPYKPDSKNKTLIFFEVLKETKDVALLSRRFNLKKEFLKGITDDFAAINILTPYVPYTIPTSFGPPTSLNYKAVTKRETLYLANDKGSIEPFVVISYKNIEPDKRRILDRSLMREFFGDSYKECKEFADRYELDIKDKDDLMALLDYYAHLD